jgi:hypothetical protein
MLVVRAPWPATSRAERPWILSGTTPFAAARYELVVAGRGGEVGPVLARPTGTLDLDVQRRRRRR